MSSTTPKLRIALIGTGHWGPNLARNFYDDPRVELKFICDLDERRAAQVAQKYRDVQVTGDIETVAAHPEVDAVVICTPTNTHYGIARRCLENRKHVFVEKPLATTSEECQSLITLATKYNRRLMVGHVFLFNPAVIYVKNLIDKQELGEIIYVYGQRLNLGPIRKDVSALWDLAPHDIAIFNYWLGGTPRSAHATGIQHLNPPLHDVVFATFRYQNNVQANLQVSWLDPRKTRQIVVVGTKGMVVFDDLDSVGPIHIYDKTVRRADAGVNITDSIQAFKAIVQEGDLVVPKIHMGEPLRNECRAFVDWLLEEKEPLCTGENGLEVVRVLEAATRSLNQSGIETPIPPRALPQSTRGLEATA